MKWPTLHGRLKHPLISTQEALEQLSQSVELTSFGKQKLKRLQTTNHHFVYILKCIDNSLYTGYTTDVNKRCNVHNRGKGAKYTRTRLPVKLVYVEEFSTKSEALKREYQIKQMTRKQKERLIDEKA